VHIAVTERYLTAKTLKIAGRAVPWPVDGNVYSDGVYTVYLKDRYGSKVTLTFTINKTGITAEPAIIAQDNEGNVFPDGSSTNKDVTVTATGSASAPAATKDGEVYPYPSDNVFTEEGAYVVSVFDTLGNETAFTFTIDKTAPEIGVLDGTGNPVECNGNVQGSAAATVSGGNVISVIKDGTPIDWADSFTEDGVYEITAQDAAGNEATFCFTIEPLAAESESGSN
jgi:hypothetical protein